MDSNIAWGYLDPLDRARLLKFHPESKGDYEREHLGYQACSLCLAVVPAQEIQDGLCEVCRMMLDKVKEG